MIAMLLKGILFYFLFVFVRNVFFGYKTYQQVKTGMGSGGASAGPRPKKNVPKNDDIVEAEYRVIKD